MIKRFIYLLLTNVLLLQAAQTQVSKEIINNQSIIDMCKAGFSKSLVLSKIESSECQFNVNTDGLIELKKQKVPETIIDAMMKKGNMSGVPKTIPTPVQPVAETKGIASKAATPDLDILNLIHAWNKKYNHKTPLEKTTAQMKSKTKALGYGGVNIVFEVSGEKSAVRLIAADQPGFIVNTGGPIPDGFVLYKLTVKKKYREAVTTNVNGVGQLKGSEGVITVNIKAMKNGLYELLPATTLEKGEYFFAQRTNSNALTSTNADIYAFGID